VVDPEADGHRDVIMEVGRELIGLVIGGENLQANRIERFQRAADLFGPKSLLPSPFR